MTLSTEVYILDEVDPAEVFRFCQALLTKYDDRPGAHEQKWKDDGGWRDDDSRCIRNEIGQGLPAILDVTYRIGGPLTTEAMAAAHTEDCEDAEESCHYYHPRACWLDVDFDTAYGYRDKRGWGCSDLHAAVVSELGAWLTSQGIRWEWRNEFTGAVHTGPDGLDELGSAGAEAQDWFATAVLPAIIGETAKNGGGELNVAGRSVTVPDLSAATS